MTVRPAEWQPIRPLVDPVDFYDAQAESLAEKYESLTFEDIHREIIDYLPAPPAVILDVGAGSGRDAAALSERGYDVLAVEPSSRLRQIAQKLHSSPRIEWIDDRLPQLQRTIALKISFDAILCSAVWMHLSRNEQRIAMQRLSGLLRPRGRLFITFRTQIFAADRPGIYETRPEKIIEDGEEAGLHLLDQSSSPDALDRSEVMWFSLIFEA